MLFYIRFRTQLRRTRPELIASLETLVTKAASAAGGTIEVRRKVLAASFDEDRIGFWLDIVIFLERVHKALEKASRELYGYTLALGRQISESSVHKLCHATGKSSGEKGVRRGTGIWFSQEISKPLNYYMEFDSSKTFRAKPPQATDNEDKNETEESEPSGSAEEYHELLKWRSLDTGKRPLPRSQSPWELPKAVPPLSVRFGAAGSALTCFADAYTLPVRSFIAGAASQEVMEELDTVHALLFRERLRPELSPYLIDQVRRFIRSLLAAYIATIKPRSARGALVLEALHLAEAAAARIFREAYLSLGEEKERIVLTAANSTDRSLKSWSNALNRDIAALQDDFPFPDRNNLKGNAFPQEILEVAYNIFLLGRYFPGYLFPELFEEEGLNREMYFRALAMLTPGALADKSPGGIHAGGVYAVSGMPVFAFHGEKTLRAGKEKIRRTVRKIILAWVATGRLRPCFNLLDILFELGGRAEDDLILSSIKSDVLNGTSQGIEKSIQKGLFDSLVGQANVPVLSYIYRTLKALACGEKDDIQQAFQEPVPPMALEDNKPCYQAYQAQVQVNLAAFYIGVRNREAASEAVRKALFLNRSLGRNAVPAYRLFSLVHLSRQRIDDALEYISFALEQAENMEQDEELAITYYFAASINFLHGNLSKAQRLALEAEKTAMALGQSVWAAWARFLLGKVTFEIGRYGEALEIFQSLGNSLDSSSAAGTAFPHGAMSDTVRAWIYRATVFLGRFPANNTAVSNLDGRLFEIEAAYLAADYERAKVLAERFLSSPNGEASELYAAESHSAKRFIFTEQPDFRSGFAQCENILLSGKTLAARTAWIYRSMSQCALRPSKEAKAEILGGMQRFMRDELLPDTDPNDPFYFYAWYCMLRDTEAAQVDMNTIVSMAYKRLQRRAGRIDDMTTRQTFLKQSSWNNTLRLAAREHNLI